MSFKHQTATFFQHRYSNAQGKLNPSTPAIISSELNSILLYATQDIENYLHNAIISFWEAIEGIEKGRSSWSLVKLYYSCFYASRALMLAGRFCIFYIGNTPYSIHIATGALPKKGSGNTHSFALKSLDNLSGSICPEINGQTIGTLTPAPPLEWMAQVRERANYKDARFPEPNSYIELEHIKNVGIRKCLADYMANNAVYIYDPDHAAICLPMLLIKKASKLSSFLPSKELKTYLSSNFNNKKLPITQFKDWIKN